MTDTAQVIDLDETALIDPAEPITEMSDLITCDPHHGLALPPITELIAMGNGLHIIDRHPVLVDQAADGGFVIVDITRWCLQGAHDLEERWVLSPTHVERVVGEQPADVEAEGSAT